MSLPDRPFEPGYDRVVRLDFEERIFDVHAIQIGRRNRRIRVEAGTDQAWEFDPAGRLIVAQQDGVSRHVTFDGRIWGHRVRGESTERRLVAHPAPKDPQQWLRRVHGRIRRWAAAPSRASWVRGAEGSANEFAAAALALPAARSAIVLDTEVEAARRIWRQVPVLPPDQYEALVLQISEGCPWDRCRFCTLYRGVPYRARTLAEIETHLRDVLRFVGASASRIRRVFLGQANALLRDTAELLEILALIRERIPLLPAGLDGPARRRWLDEHTPSTTGFFAFVDAFHRARPESEWRVLREAGLSRVYVGLESGDADRLRALGKPLDPARAVELVQVLHAAGIPVGVILMTGIASGSDEVLHRERSAEVVASMQLRTGDQVYLSPLVHPAGGELETLRSQDGDLLCSGAALERMRASLRSAIGRGVPIAAYDLQRLAARTPRG
jgi:hypothetical protein